MTQEKLISDAREWLTECFEEQADEIAEASAAVIVKNVNRFYDGGWASFVNQSERV
jgi:3-mercaptopyruvate sulfurtransferase SseA